jgi:20S proteasome alpha/beta subunit
MLQIPFESEKTIIREQILFEIYYYFRMTVSRTASLLCSLKERISFYGMSFMIVEEVEKTQKLYREHVIVVIK